MLGELNLNKTASGETSLYRVTIYTETATIGLSTYRGYITFYSASEITSMAELESYLNTTGTVYTNTMLVNNTSSTGIHITQLYKLPTGGVGGKCYYYEATPSTLEEVLTIGQSAVVSRRVI